jgi:hypothetical protein
VLVKMRVGVSGLRDGVPWPPVGGTIDLPASEALHLFEQRMADPVHDPESGVERAVVDESDVEMRLDTSSAAALVPNSPKKRGRPRKAAAQ